MSPAAAAPSRRATPGVRVIVADDNRDAATGLAMILREEGSEVFEVYRGDAVLGLTATFHPDVLILDIGMPGLTGFEIAHALRRSLGQACPLLIAVTAWTQASARELGKASGFSHYLTKPYSTDALLEILSSVVPGGSAGRRP
jgi:DNA-binding response OmpR family regulator